jgi:hypothetical protein
MPDQWLKLERVTLGHLYVYRGNGHEFSFRILGARPKEGIFVQASQEKNINGEMRSRYWIPCQGRFETAATGELVFVLDT